IAAAKASPNHILCISPSWHVAPQPSCPCEGRSQCEVAHAASKKISISYGSLPPPFPTPEAGPAFHPEAGPFYCGIGPVTGGLFSSQRARTSTLLHPRDYPGAGHGGPPLRGRGLAPWAPAAKRTDPPPPPRRLPRVFFAWSRPPPVL